MGVENGSQSIPWGGEWRRHLRSDAEMGLVRSWMRRVECPTSKAAVGRACRTAGGRPTNEHRARRDAVGPIPYEEWRKEGLIPEQRTYRIPAVLEESEKARAEFIQGQEAMDHIDDAVRKLIEVRDRGGTADVVAVLAARVASLLAASAAPDGAPEALFGTMIRAQIATAHKMQKIQKECPEG